MSGAPGSKMEMKSLKSRDIDTTFCEGRLLSIDEIRSGLKKYKAREQRMAKMLTKLQHADEYFLPAMLRLYRSLEPRRFPVSRVMHVTIKANFLSILNEERFRGSEIQFLLKGEEKFLRVSCWGVDITLNEEAKEAHLKSFQLKLYDNEIRWNPSQEGRRSVSDMLANSPVFQASSRYGNFHFSFGIEELLEQYKVQHCGGAAPVLRVLGTQTYKQEIVHWILIHSPAHSKEFSHLPPLPQVTEQAQEGHIYQGADNTITWKPESTTNNFTWRIRSQLLQRIPEPSYDAWVWNYPVFAFHLPEDQALMMDKSLLLENVKPCDTARDFNGEPATCILHHPKSEYVGKESAEKTIAEEQSEKTIAEEQSEKTIAEEQSARSQGSSLS